MLLVMKHIEMVSCLSPAVGKFHSVKKKLNGSTSIQAYLMPMPGRMLVSMPADYRLQGHVQGVGEPPPAAIWESRRRQIRMIVPGSGPWRISGRIGSTENDDISLYWAGLNCKEPLHPAVCRSLSYIRDCNKAVTVKELSARLNLSTRYLNRVFHESFGIAPKRFLRIIRFHHALTQLQKEGLGIVALKNGYYDQSHFTREFKEMSCLSPALLRGDSTVYGASCNFGLRFSPLVIVGRDRKTDSYSQNNLI